MWRVLLFLSFIISHINGWEITKFSTPQIDTPVSPVWDDGTQSLYFVNSLTTGEQACIFRYSYNDGMFYSAFIEGINSPSFIVPTKKKCRDCKNECGQQFFAVGYQNHILIIRWNGKSTKAKVVKTLFEFDIPYPLYRTNYGRADPYGRFYGGTFEQAFCNATPTASMYKYTKHDGLVRLFGGLKSTTGIVFDENRGKMYHDDSCQLTITEYDWDPETGDICNGRVLFVMPLNGIPINTNYPMGLDIDNDGNLWYGHYKGAVYKVDSRTGKILETIPLPDPGVGGIALGGPNRDMMFAVTGAKLVDVMSVSIVGEISPGTSLIAITNLGVSAPKSSRLNVKCPKKECHF